MSYRYRSLTHNRHLRVNNWTWSALNVETLYSVLDPHLWNGELFPIQHFLSTSKQIQAWIYKLRNKDVTILFVLLGFRFRIQISDSDLRGSNRYLHIRVRKIIIICKIFYWILTFYLSWPRQQRAPLSQQRECWERLQEISFTVRYLLNHS